jgi:hypothetical protein
VVVVEVEVEAEVGEGGMVDVVGVVVEGVVVVVVVG